MKNKRIILFDGVCNLCNGGVQFVLKKDKNNIFNFSSLQSEFGQKKLLELNFDSTNFYSFLYLKDDKVYTKSSAALQVCKELSGPIKLLSIFLIVPKFIRDLIYSLIAKNRYKWFGKQDSCWLPTPDLQTRFIN